MNKYESVIIISPTLEEDAVKALVERFSGMINENGKVEKVDMLGKRKLAYEIKKNKEAYYVVMNYEAKVEVITELERNFKILDEVIKFMTIRAN